MTRSAQVLILLATLVSAATAQSVSEHPGIKGKFSTSKGDVIELDTQTGTLDTPRTHSTDLQDCSDKFQVCLTDHHGFAFAFFRKCSDEFENYKRLKFPQQVVSVLHNTDVWLVFDAAPNYMFHYANRKGIVGIYIGPTASYDFRSVLRDPNFRVFDLDSVEFRIVGSDSVGACS